jgi:twitching motility protein PilT
MDRSVFHKLLSFGIERGASDLHYEVGYPPHYRIHGELLGAMKVPPLTAQDTETIARMILEDRHITVDFARRFTELEVSYSLAQRGRFRATIFRQRGAVGIVMRLIPIQVPSLEELQLPPAFGELALERRGLVLVTGPAGSGKTTALAAMLRHINETRHAHVITIEDPIEYLHEPGRCMVIQREIGTDTESFHDAMAAALRQDPDVIVLSELGDRATAADALRAAETGLLVLAAIDAPDVLSALRHFVGLLGPGAETGSRRLADVLQGVVSLRLLPGKQGPANQGPGNQGPGNQGPGNQGAGPEHRRRIPAVEIVRGTRAVREHVRTGRLAELPELLRQPAEARSAQLFDQHLRELVGRELISRETALDAAVSPEELERLLRED